MNDVVLLVVGFALVMAPICVAWFAMEWQASRSRRAARLRRERRRGYIL